MYEFTLHLSKHMFDIDIFLPLEIDESINNLTKLTKTLENYLVYECKHIFIFKISTTVKPLRYVRE